MERYRLEAVGLVPSAFLEKNLESGWSTVYGGDPDFGTRFLSRATEEGNGGGELVQQKDLGGNLGEPGGESVFEYESPGRQRILSTLQSDGPHRSGQALCKNAKREGSRVLFLLTNQVPGPFDGSASSLHSDEFLVANGGPVGAKTSVLCCEEGPGFSLTSY